MLGVLVHKSRRDALIHNYLFCMDKDETKDKTDEYKWQEMPWRAWGSWFSWGSPVGLSIFLSSVLMSVGVFLLLLHHAGLLR